MTISKDIKFDCAHMLSNYEGKCSNLHGHTYHGTVTIEGNVNPETGMVLDYNTIKNAVDKFDHAIIFSNSSARNDAETDLYRWARTYEMKAVELLSSKSTAEGIATCISSDLIQFPNVTAVHVRLSETDGSWAIVEVEK